MQLKELQMIAVVVLLAGLLVGALKGGAQLQDFMEVGAETMKFYAVFALIGGTLIAAYYALEMAVKTTLAAASGFAGQLQTMTGHMEAMTGHLKDMVEGIGYCSTKLNFLERRMAAITSTL